MQISPEVTNVELVVAVGRLPELACQPFKFSLCKQNTGNEAQTRHLPNATAVQYEPGEHKLLSVLSSLKRKGEAAMPGIHLKQLSLNELTSSYWESTCTQLKK